MKRAPARKDISAERLRELISYDPETGAFHWRVYRGSGARAGDPAGAIEGNKHRYLRLTIDGHHYMAHRLAWLYVHGEWPEQLVDHRDGNSLNNKLENLRLASNLENTRNNSKRGYCWDRTHWIAYIYVSGKQIVLGRFTEAEQAKAAREAGTIKHFGEFSSVNRGP